MLKRATRGPRNTASTSARVSDHPADAIDAAILAAMRGGAHPPKAAFAYALAYRHSVDRGLDTTRTAPLAALCGYDVSNLNKGRQWIDQTFPGWEPAVPAAEMVARPAHAVAPAPTWRKALAQQMGRVAGRKSWDLYREAYGPAADVVLNYGEMGDLVALVVDYVEAVTGEDLEGTERSRVAKLTRNYGKSALYALSEAVHRTDDQTVAEYVRYATAVCKNTAAKVRAREATAASQNGTTP